jgi:hypothetical protein
LEVSVDYLLHDSAAAPRAYAQSSASDGVISYSMSANHSVIQKNWIRRVYEYLGGILNVAFQEVPSGGEFRIDVQNENLWDTYLEGNGLHNVVGTSGDLSWRSWHDRKQYGGVDAQREVVRMIGRSLGLSYPNGEPWSETYTTNNTVISHTLSEPNENLGHTFFFTDDDQTALKTIFGSKSSDALTGQRFDHRQRIEEDLLIGRNGQVDTFFLVSKGINYSNSAAKYVESSGRVWNNDYIIPSIANFNPGEGDKILIQKRLFLPASPIDPSTSNKSLPKKFELSGKQVSTKKFLKKVRINFSDIQSLRALPSDQQNDAIFSSKVNLHINGAGKLLINANGTSPNLGPYGDDISVNGQLLGFLDVYGPFGGAIQGEWFGLF